MDIYKEIEKIDFENFNGIVDATLSLIVKAKQNDIKITETEYTVYEKHVLGLGKFEESYTDLVKDILRGQFYYLQQITADTKKQETQETIKKPEPKQSFDVDENTITSIDDWVKLGILTEEQANIKKIEPPDWMKEMQENAKRVTDGES